MNVRLRATPAPWWHGVQFLLCGTDGKSVLKPENLVLDDIPAHEGVDNPSFQLDLKEAQVLMDDLWASGIRPTEGRVTTGALKATERHLEDMRKIVFDHLKQM